MTMRAIVPAATTVLSAREWRALCALRARYRPDRDLLSAKERARLRFLCWLVHSGRLVPEGEEDSMDSNASHPDEGERTPDERERTRPWVAQRGEVADAVAALRDRIARAWERSQSTLNELRAERDDAALAVDHARAEQAGGVPAPMLGVLQARLETCQAAVEAMQAHLVRLSALDNALSEWIRSLGPPDER